MSWIEWPPRKDEKMYIQSKWKVMQMIPADGWYAAYKREDGYFDLLPLSMWVLRECIDPGCGTDGCELGDQEIIGYNAWEGEGVDGCTNDLHGYVRRGDPIYEKYFVLEKGALV